MLNLNNSYIKKIYFLFIISSYLMSQAQAGQLNILLENDGLFANDGNYTNGFSFGWESKALLSHQQYLPATIPLFFQLQHHLRLPINQSHTAWGMNISQRMWTPNKISSMEAQNNERPYAGFLQIESHLAEYSTKFSQKNWLSLGIIGPKSKAEQVQTKVHSFSDYTPPNGWQYQVQEQVTLQLAYEVDALLFRSSKLPGNLFNHNQWEASSYSHIALGNFNTEASLGLLFRWGTMLNKTFGRLSSHFGHIGNTTDVISSNNFTAYSRLQLGYRFSDLTIEGRLPYESDITIEPKQAKATIGVNWTINNYAITWSLNSYTRSYHSDKKSWHSYASLTLSCAI